MLGKATILLLISQGVFLVSGYTVNVGLARLLGPADFGTFGVVMSVLLVIQLFVITGIPIALQKFVAENMDSSRLLHRRVLPRHLIYSVAVFALAWLAAPVIAGLLDDAMLTTYLQVAFIDIIFYGLYKYYLSMQNGLHQFEKQTISGIAYAFCKPVAIFILVFMGYGIQGAVIGNMLGSVGGFVIGVLIVRFPEIKGQLEDIPFFKFAFTNVFYFVGLQLLFSIDIWFVKYYLSDEIVGQYVSASSMAKIPYFLSLAISSALLPSISKATKDNDEKRVRDIIRISLRYWLMLLFGMMSVVGAVADPLILLFFGADYAPAGPILAVLFAAVALLTFSAVMNTILISRDDLKACLVVIAVLIILHVIGNSVLVPVFDAVGAALATLGVAFVSIALSGFLLIRNSGVIMPALSVLRLIVSAGFVFAIVFFMPFLREGFLLRGIMTGMMFVVILFLLRELSIGDIKRFHAVIMPSGTNNVS